MAECAFTWGKENIHSSPCPKQNFGQRDKLQDQMSQVSTVYNSIMDKIAQRREVVEDQLKKIEAEIRFMTMKARLEERQRLRAEREQSFRETFFDTRTSEFEEQ